MRTLGSALHPVVFNATLEEVLNLIGTFVFAVSGALLAVRKNYDIVGMAVLAGITAIGGGVIRDLVIGAVPPAAFTDAIYFLLPLLATALTFFAHVQMNRLNAAVLVFDAAGLAVFCISGTAKALNYGLGPVPAAALGVLTAVGGGIMRDVLAQEEPSVLSAKSELYALPAAFGSVIVVVIPHLPIKQFSRGWPYRSLRIHAAPPRVAVRLESSSTLAHHRQAVSIQVGEGGASSGPLETKRDGEDIPWIHLLKKLLIHR